MSGVSEPAVAIATVEGRGRRIARSTAFGGTVTLDLLALPGAVGHPSDGQFTEDRDVAAIGSLGQPPDEMPPGRLGLRPEVAVTLSGDDGRQQDVSQPEQLPEDLPFHRVDPQAVLGGPLDELPQGVELVVGLDGGLLDGHHQGEVP